MNGVLSWFARNSVAANLLMWLIVVGGLSGLRATRVQVTPEVTPDLIEISVVYPGAGPEEVEEAVCARIEERVRDLRSVRRVYSAAAEGLGRVTVEILDSADPLQALDDVKARLDTIDSFPEETEEPVVREILPRPRALSLAISGRADERSLTLLAEQVREDLLALGGITQVDLRGVRPYEVTIEVSEQELRRHGLTFDEVARAVRRSSIDLPGGSVKSGTGEILLRTEGQAYRGPEFEELLLFSRADGTRLALGDVASVDDGFAETYENLRFNGDPAVLVEVFRVGDQDVREIAGRVKAYLPEARARLPEGIRLTLWQDETEGIRSRLGTLLENGRDGFLLVLLVLALFLKPRLATWVALGIPISFLGAFWCLPALDFTINLTSLLGFLIVLGIVVDDAIVVGENVYRHHEQGKSGVDAAVDGVREVAVPVFFAVLTTIAVFAPMMTVPGMMGKLMKIIPVVVILVLLFSLAESLLILPAHLSHLKARTAERRGPWDRFQAGVTARLDGFVGRIYAPLLERALNWRATTLAIAFALLLLSLGLVAGGRLRFLFFPPAEADSVTVSLTLPQGTPVELTAGALDQIQESAWELQRQLDEEGGGPIRHVLAAVGSQPTGLRFSGRPTLDQRGSHLGAVTVALVSGDERGVEADEIARRLRDLVGAIPDAVELSFNSAIIDAGKAIDVELAGRDLDELRRAVAWLKSVLAEYPGVYGVGDTLRAGKREVRLSVTREAESSGLTLSDLARQVRQAFYGEEIQRIQRGAHELKVMVRYPEVDRRRLATLENMYVRTPDGQEIPFAVVGRMSPGRGLAAIERTDGRRTAHVTADVDPRSGNANQIRAELRAGALPELVRNHTGVSYSFAGEQQEQSRAMAGLRRSTVLALFLVYALLAIPFRSYLQPFLVMSAIPFGVVGAIWGHLLMGYPLTFWSLLGILALVGVVVNDSLVLVDFANRARREGISHSEAVRLAAKTRFRPIVLASITTFAGLLPLIFEGSTQAQFLIPMAISIAFGVLFATLITLILVPVLYTLLEDLKSLPWTRRREARTAELPGVTP